VFSHLPNCHIAAAVVAVVVQTFILGLGKVRSEIVRLNFIVFGQVRKDLEIHTIQLSPFS
jgi:hypothetical protein